MKPVPHNRKKAEAYQSATQQHELMAEIKKNKRQKNSDMFKKRAQREEQAQLEIDVQQKEQAQSENDVQQEKLAKKGKSKAVKEVISQPKKMKKN